MAESFGALQEFLLSTWNPWEAKIIMLYEKLILVSFLLIVIKISHLKPKPQLRYLGTPDVQLILDLYNWNYVCHL